jgi:hypothetical protein
MGMKRPSPPAFTACAVALAFFWVPVGHLSAADSTEPAPLWSLQPITDPPLPAVRSKDWPTTTPDQFILAELEKNGLEPSADADGPTMLRRLSFDLAGLPPSLAEIADFEKAWAHDPQAAIAQTADRLRASPDFGVRWGRHWLDVARYAESSGNTRNMAYVLAWRYRNWVIESLNKNTPFDQFIRRQIAGDLLPAATPQERDDNVLGTGFLTVGVKSLGEQDLVTYELNIADDQIDATTRAFLGLTAACARCHDHKFDPIPARDYYALAGIFRSTAHFTGVQTNNRKEEADGVALGPNWKNHLAEVKAHDTQLAAMQKQYEEVAKKRNTMREELVKAGVEPAKAQKETMPPEMAEKLTELRGLDESVEEWKARLKKMKESAPPRPILGMAVQEKPATGDSPLYYKGDPKKPQEVVPRGALSTIATLPFRDIPPSESGRRQLADWIASADNPLTGRVIVNRVWQHLFGRGLVETPDDFGTMGVRPSHPALLDHLAFRFVREGWDVKALIRELVSSRAYRQTSLAASDAPGRQKDPANKMLWRMSRKPLEAEALRDALLELGGKLDRTPLAGSQVATLAEPVTPQGRELGRRGFLYNLTDEPNRRSIYLPVVRGAANPAMQCFDVADPNLVTGQRHATIVPGQVLFLLNSDLVLDQAQGLAARILAEPSDTLDARINKAWRLALCRPPSAAEARALHETLAPTPEDPAAWARVCQTLMLTAEFRLLE